MNTVYISLNSVCLITGYKKGFIFSKVAALQFPQPVRRSNTLMFPRDKVLEWDKTNRVRLIDKFEAIKLLHVTWNEFADLISDDRFPEPAFYDARSPLWILGDILNYRAKWRL